MESRCLSSGSDKGTDKGTYSSFARRNIDIETTDETKTEIVFHGILGGIGAQRI
jgi:hypothetical protein